ncbi:MAG: hypothetical protein E7575_05070 [Ruminococcaceae bacterium]|nr:hypothetical protein [Oscillospiraceae bacterium]
MLLSITYDNFDFSNSTFSLNAIIWGICLGLAAGVAAYIFSKHFSSKLIKALVLNECNSKDNAKTPEELGLKPTAALSLRLADVKTVRKYVLIANEEECIVEKKQTKLSKFSGLVRRLFYNDTDKKRYDMTKARLYIPEDKRHTAEIRYESKGSPWIIAIIAAILFIGAAVALTLCMPKLLELTDGAINSFKKL